MSPAGSFSFDLEILNQPDDVTCGPTCLHAVYRYFDVPESEYRDLLSADSVGRYLNQSIKSTYRYGRLQAAGR